MRAILTIFPRSVPRELPAPSRPTPTVEAPAAPVPATAESAVIERLLAELDARGVARAPGPYQMERPPRNRLTGWFCALLAVTWLMSIVLCVFVVKYLDRDAAAQPSNPAQAQSMNHLASSIGDQNRQFSRLIDSVENLANAVASSSANTTAVQTVLRRLNRDLSQTQSTPKPPPPPAPVTIAQLERPETPGPSFGSHHHEPLEDVIAPRYAIVHHSESGVMDYWLVPRLISGTRVMVKVFPIAQTSLGIFVHSLEEVKDFVVTPSGDWLAASDPKVNP